MWQRQTREPAKGVAATCARTPRHRQRQFGVAVRPSCSIVCELSSILERGAPAEGTAVAPKRLRGDASDLPLRGSVAYDALQLPPNAYLANEDSMMTINATLRRTRQIAGDPLCNVPVRPGIAVDDHQHRLARVWRQLPAPPGTSRIIVGILDIGSTARVHAMVHAGHQLVR